MSAIPDFPDRELTEAEKLAIAEGGRQSEKSSRRLEREQATQDKGNGLADDANHWPEPLGEAAYHGLAGEIVCTIEPQTEADTAAILLQTLVAFGALVGRGPHVRVEGDEHHCNLFAVLVGETAKARKGTSWGRVRELFGIAEWPAVVSGLSSGEGLKWAVRDRITKIERNKKTGVAEEVEIDAGVLDKRLLVIEPEFSSVLSQGARAGNTLSATLRCAWDSGNLRTLTKNDPVIATGAHVCAIGHITADELRAQLTATDTANGFANRFLFCCTRRSKKLPFGGAPLDRALLAEFGSRISMAATKARTRSAVMMAPRARDAWAAVYDRLSEGWPGLFGAVTARAEAQCIRLALLYALLDGASAIDGPHILAALEVWSRCEGSARFIFGSALGDPGGTMRGFAARWFIFAVVPARDAAAALRCAEPLAPVRVGHVPPVRPWAGCTVRVPRDRAGAGQVLHGGGEIQFSIFRVPYAVMPAANSGSFRAKSLGVNLPRRGPKENTLGAAFNWEKTMAFGLQEEERRVIDATLKFANLRLTPKTLVPALFQGIKNRVVLRRIGGEPSYHEDQERLRRWLQLIVGDSARGIARERAQVADEVSRFLGSKVKVSMRLQQGRLDYFFALNDVESGYAWAVALLLDGRRGVTNRLKQCGYSQCLKFIVDWDPKGRPRRFCNDAHKDQHRREIAKAKRRITTEKRNREKQ